MRGKPASLEEAIRAAADLIREARLLFGGLATDVDGMRAAMALADRAGGVVDHALSGARSPTMSRCCRRVAGSPRR